MKSSKLTIATAFLFSALTTASIAAVPQIANIQVISNVEMVQLKRRSKVRRYERRKRRSRGSRSLPQAHIDYCVRQNMGYRVSDNTIAFDRWTRGQCYSPYFN